MHKTFWIMNKLHFYQTSVKETDILSPEGNFLVKKLCRFEKTLPLWKFGAVSEIACQLQKMCEAFPLALPVELSSANCYLTLSKNLAIWKKTLPFQKTPPLQKKAAFFTSKKLPSFLIWFLNATEAKEDNLIQNVKAPITVPFPPTGNRRSE